ncbi:response regulator [Deinococcus rubellus]|uniref:response regulator n=1 Tax=Deinococcus rubellus TaxID=1889240 RepID=UPI0031E5E46E
MPRILVVDDSLSVRKALEKILNIYADVSVAIGAEDALAQLHGGLDAPDLVISDVLMPGMSGFELTLELQKIPAMRKVPVILISGIIDEDVQRRALEVGVRAVVRKPFTADELLPVIQQELVNLNHDAVVPAASPVALPPPPTVSPVAQQSWPVRAVEMPTPIALTSAAPVAATLAPTVAMGNLNSTHASATTLSGSTTLVSTLIQKPGVLGVLVTTRDGTPLDHAGDLGFTLADLSMYARFFANTASTLGTRLNSGAGTGVQLEYASRTLLILPLDETQLLVSLLSDASSTSMVRFAVRRHLTPG